jgi:hypothetical protein
MWGFVMLGIGLFLVLAAGPDKSGRYVFRPRAYRRFRKK